MALTCSVLGHAYGDPTVERDREERGSEVVVTIREYETCNRCGTTRIVSENKEVTAVEAEADATDSIDEGPADPDDDADADDVGDAPVDLGDAEAAIPDDGPDDLDPAEPTDDGAEIMDAEAGDPIDEELAAPSVSEPDDEPADAPEEDAVVLDDDGEGRAPGEWPEEDDPVDESELTPGSERDDAGPAVEDSPGRTITVPEGEFRCGECGYTTPVESSSLRAGDFCPECRQGTLEHVREE